MKTIVKAHIVRTGSAGATPRYTLLVSPSAVATTARSASCHATITDAARDPVGAYTYDAHWRRGPTGLDVRVQVAPYLTPDQITTSRGADWQRYWQEQGRLRHLTFPLHLSELATSLDRVARRDAATPLRGASGKDPPGWISPWSYLPPVNEKDRRVRARLQLPAAFLRHDRLAELLAGVLPECEYLLPFPLTLTFRTDSTRPHA